jgi:phosphoglycerate dehydrogenase-like enzyme
MKVPENIVDLAPRLKWIQCPLAGVDQILNTSIVNSKVLITNASGIHGPAISELVLAMMLDFARNMVQCYEMKQQKDWRKISTTLLESKTLGIIGLGSIGNAVARRAKAFDMRVVGVRRSIIKVTRSRYVDAIYPREQLNKLLKESDYVVLVLPFTQETDRMIGENQLKFMKPTARLINVGRGNTVDEEALIRALELGWIAGAGLDCYSNEPLPVESKIWNLSNVIMTPKNAHGGRENTEPKIIDIFCENLKRYLDGKRLINVVNKKAGY